jgi:hypothetical protein
MVSSKRILINLLTTFAAEGYNLVSSYRTSAKSESQLQHFPRLQ